ncbi:DNA polymerase III subunit beta [Candidatus Curtissbacteria bacterium RBG_13_35_7]|uniref:Beta sliding clamp n=1 Tax=Candidatus Curtissbacteria bacterium RBG_13_35_7 TaxID=1797705 RepID=A0A1F5G0X9_9BACT|nr:MAG: DNA polymerase III subunit beta [Candidatus Curtissbacteria bacterium RBG_13_35_7]
MKFEILQPEFSKALLTCAKSILTRANLPILSNILIRAKKEGLEILATNLETATRVEVKCKVESEGEITVNGKILLEFVSQLPEGNIVFEKLGEEVLIKSKGYNGRFTTMPSDEFPAIPKIEKGISVEIGAREFVGAVSKVAFSASMDEGRPMLTGVLGDLTRDRLKIVATDGYRLGYQEIKIENAKNVPNLKIIIPARAIMEVAKILTETGLAIDEEEKEKKDEKFTVLVADALNQISFKIGTIEFTSRLIEGVFPNWQKIIPANFVTKTKVNKGEFVKLVKIASIFARESGSIIRLKFEQKTLSVSAASSQVGSSDATCEVEMSGKGGEIAFNYKYLLEVLSVIGGEEIYFEMNESLNPGKITSLDAKDSFFHIIMPVRLQS